MDGLPLAIELIAPPLKSLTVGDILRQWESRLAAVVSGPRDAPARHRTLHNAIQWSYDLLSLEEQRVWAHLGVFLGGCTAEAVQAVMDHTTSVLPVLEALHDASVLYTQSSANTSRFLMLETIGEFALEMLTASEGRERVEERYIAYFAQLADGAYSGLLGPDRSRAAYSYWHLALLVAARLLT